MDDCTQEAMLRCVHVLSITGCRSNNYWETDKNKHLTKSVDCEIEVEVKYGWLHSRGHAKMYKSANYHCCRNNSYWETDLNVKLKKVTWLWNIGHKWPSSKLHLKIKTNILSKIHIDCFKNVTSRMLTKFSFDFARWPSFWPQVTQFWSKPKEH